MGRTALNHLDDVTPDDIIEVDEDGTVIAVGPQWKARALAAEASLVSLRSEIEQVVKQWEADAKKAHEADLALESDGRLMDAASEAARAFELLKCAKVLAALARGGE